jgi:hypothetical protein
MRTLPPTDRYNRRNMDSAKAQSSATILSEPQPQQPLATPVGKKLLPWLVAVAFFMESLDTTILNTAVPVVSEALHVSPLAMKSVLASYTLSLAVFIPISGWMADRFGTRRVFAAAMGLFTLGSFLCGIANDIHLLVACRLLQGYHLRGLRLYPVHQREHSGLRRYYGSRSEQRQLHCQHPAAAVDELRRRYSRSGHRVICSKPCRRFTAADGSRSPQGTAFSRDLNHLFKFDVPHLAARRRQQCEQRKGHPPRLISEVCSEVLLQGG